MAVNKLRSGKYAYIRVNINDRECKVMDNYPKKFGVMVCDKPVTREAKRHYERVSEICADKLFDDFCKTGDWQAFFLNFSMFAWDFGQNRSRLPRAYFTERIISRMRNLGGVSLTGRDCSKCHKRFRCYTEK